MAQITKKCISVFCSNNAGIPDIKNEYNYISENLCTHCYDDYDRISIPCRECGYVVPNVSMGFISDPNSHICQRCFERNIDKNDKKRCCLVNNNGYVTLPHPYQTMYICGNQCKESYVCDLHSHLSEIKDNNIITGYKWISLHFYCFCGQSIVYYHLNSAIHPPSHCRKCSSVYRKFEEKEKKIKRLDNAARKRQQNLIQGKEKYQQIMQTLIDIGFPLLSVTIILNFSYSEKFKTLAKIPKCY
jgi:hypothetical protein